MQRRPDSRRRRLSSATQADETNGHEHLRAAPSIQDGYLLARHPPSWREARARIGPELPKALRYDRAARLELDGSAVEFRVVPGAAIGTWGRPKWVRGHRGERPPAAVART